MDRIMKPQKTIAALAIIFVLTVSCSKDSGKPPKSVDENAISARIDMVEEAGQKASVDADIKPEAEIIDPDEFKDSKWQRSFGDIRPVDDITLNDLQSCSWHKFFTVLQFSEQGHYATGDRWSGAVFGNYELDDNTVIFDPPLSVYRFDEKHSMEKLYYSNELYYEGSPVLKNEDESVLFYPNGAKPPKIGETVKINRVYCEIMDEKTKININNILYALPDRESKNLFLNNHYGNRSSAAAAKKLAKASIEDVLWYYMFVDFTGDDPSDGGGPYYYGWLPEEYLDSAENG